jgi:hypothetical protein
MVLFPPLGFSGTAEHKQCPHLPSLLTIHDEVQGLNYGIHHNIPEAFGFAFVREETSKTFNFSELEMEQARDARCARGAGENHLDAPR